MKLSLAFPACLLALLLTGCASSGQETKTVVIDTFCLKAKPIRVSRYDVLTDGTAKDILSHNEMGAKDCVGWLAKE